jgi:ABC-2 type transport system ATP-binding protein
VLILHQGRLVAFGSIPEIVAARPDLAGRSLEEVFFRLVGRDAGS